MAFKRDQGKTKTMYFPKAASTAFTDGALVIFDGSGHVTPAISTSAQLVGVIRKTVASTDSDYASNTMVPVQVPIELYVTWVALTASAVAGDVGAQVDLTDSVTVNRGGTSHKVVTITGVRSATEVLVVLNSLYAVKNGS